MFTEHTTHGSPVTTPDVNILFETQYRTYDGLLAAGLCLCFLIGFPGNCLSLIFFVRSQKRNLPTVLYTTACCIDMVSCLMHLPVTVNLLNKRNPGLLEDDIFCGFWYITFSCVQFMSMFVVMLLAVTRAIIIIVPFFKIKKKIVFSALVFAFLYFLSWELAYILRGKYFYSRALAYCEFDYGDGSIHHLYNTNSFVTIGVIPLIVFVAAAVAIFNLKTRDQVHNDSQKKCRQASMTIICFAVVFLACNFFTFLNVAVVSFSHISDKGYAFYYKNTFMFFYSWQLSGIFCVVLNATLNPILYIYRFKGMRIWLREMKKWLSEIEKLLSEMGKWMGGVRSWLSGMKQRLNVIMRNAE